MAPEGLIANQQPAAELDLDAIVRELDAGMDVFPVEALRMCQRHREVVTPRLIEVLREATRLGREGIVREGNAHFFALFLLTEFQAKQALPVVLDLLSLRDPVLDGLISDAVTEVGRRALAVLGEDQPDLLEAMISDRQLDDFVRWEVAAAMVCLVRDGSLARNEAVERLARQMRAAVEADDPWGVTITVCELADLNPLEHQDEIKAAFERELVDESIIDWNFIEEKLLDSEHPGICRQLDDRKPSAIEDTVEELQGWYCFSEEYRRLRASPPVRVDRDENREKFWDDGRFRDSVETGPGEDASDYEFVPTNPDSATFAMMRRALAGTIRVHAEAGRSIRSAV